VFSVAPIQHGGKSSGDSSVSSFDIPTRCDPGPERFLRFHLDNPLSVLNDPSTTSKTANSGPRFISVMCDCQHFTANTKEARPLREALEQTEDGVCVCVCVYTCVHVAPQGSRCVHPSAIHIPSRRTEQRQNTQDVRRSSYTSLSHCFSSFTQTHTHTHTHTHSHSHNSAYKYAGGP